MPLKDLFAGPALEVTREDRERKLYEAFAVLRNPFPNAAQTSDHPRMPTEEDSYIDNAVKNFYDTRRSRAIAITASQGVGKTNLLNSYEAQLQETLYPLGFFIIRYVADPEPSFDPLVRSIFEFLGKDHLRRSIQRLAKEHIEVREKTLSAIRTLDVKKMLEALLGAQQTSEEQFNISLRLAYEWLLGFPVRKAHQEALKVYFRLDTVESKTRALRDIVYFSAEVKTLQGVFLLLDELEKQDSSLSKTIVLRYLSAVRALIDALPKYLFLMVALTPDALDRYREMLPALRGRLTDQVNLPLLRDEKEAMALWSFYIDRAHEEAANAAGIGQWKAGVAMTVNEDDARGIFHELSERALTNGVRQREYLNALYDEADKRIAEHST